MSTHTDLIVVRLVRYPLDVYQRSDEHFEGLKREFALLGLSDTSGLPRRLIDLVDALTSQYAGPVTAADQVRQEAIRRGETELAELRYDLPAPAVGATKTLAKMLDDADAFCRQGQHLLSLATPPESLAFRRWYFGEFIAQAQGLEPLPWPDAEKDALVASAVLRGDTSPAG